MEKQIGDSKEWVRYNQLTHTYDTKDGTMVCASLVDNAETMLDIFYIASIRHQQREKVHFSLARHTEKINKNDTK